MCISEVDLSELTVMSLGHELDEAIRCSMFIVQSSVMMCSFGFVSNNVLSGNEERLEQAISLLANEKEPKKA